MVERERETVVVSNGGGGNGGGTLAVLAVVLMLCLGAYLLYASGLFGEGSADIDVNVDAPGVDVVPDGQ
jgi:hypothetical protein